MLRNIFINLVFIVLLNTSLNAQENLMSQILMARELLENSNLDNYNKVPDLINNQPKINQGNIPTSRTPKNVNSNDLRNPNISTIQNVEQRLTLSQIEQYYHLLTPESLPIFGQDAFSNQENPNLLFFNTMGQDYRLAPGDIINVVIRGLNPLDKKIQISMDGMIVLPNLQPIFVEGLNLELIEKKLLEGIQIDDFSATVNVSLNAARLVPIQITGAAQRPKTIAVPAYTPFSRIISLVGGIRKDGSFRDITLTNSSNIEISIDLYDLLRGTNKFEDHLITGPSRIHINDIGFTVAVSGFAGRPGIFELEKNSTSIAVSEVLDLANTKMIPPGSILEIVKFDKNGIIQKQKISNLDDQYLNTGELLNIELRNTTNTEKISVQGAILKEYEIYGNQEKSLAEILKFGAALREDAILDFAVIKSELATKTPPRSVDLHFALNNPDKVLVQPGETVLILNQDLYNSLVKYTNNYLLNNLQVSDQVLYASQSNAEPGTSLQEGSGINVFESANTYVANLRQILRSVEIIKLLRTTQKVFIDNKLSELIPDLPKNSKKITVMEKLILPRDLNPDFAIKVENFETTNKVLTSFNPKKIFRDEQTEETNKFESSKANIKLFTNQYLASIFKREPKLHPSSHDIAVNQIGSDRFESKRVNGENNVATKHLVRSEIDATQPTKIYLDGKFWYLISQDSKLKDSYGFNLLKTNTEIYPFFVRTLKANKNFEIQIPKVHYDTLFNIDSVDFKLSKIEFYTTKFVQELLKDKEINLTNILAEQNKDKTGSSQMMAPQQIESSNIGLDQVKFDQLGSQQMKLTQPKQIGKSQKVGEEKTENNLFEHEEAFKRNSKLISGALEKPGFYPIIGEITLADIISLAGGILPGADLNNITIREYGDSNGKTSIVGTKYINISSVNPKKIILDGHFTVYVPFLVNDADVGSIVLEGEILHPGKYSFSRNETLHEVLERAGGLTLTAYPLGASFYREGLKKEQKVSNENLAREVEQSILFLSQSQLTGAGDQIKAVIAYANQLKNIPTSGKQNLNLEGSSRTMLLQDGDKLHIPKRPSHVTISGSVQNPVTAIYETDKTLEAYVSEAGGFKRIADKKKIFVLLPNGENVTISSIQKNKKPIPAGSVIVVPPRTDKITALGLTDIWSRVLANIATSILAINAATD